MKNLHLAAVSFIVSLSLVSSNIQAANNWVENHHKTSATLIFLKGVLDVCQTVMAGFQGVREDDLHSKVIDAGNNATCQADPICSTNTKTIGDRTKWAGPLAWSSLPSGAIASGLDIGAFTLVLLKHPQTAGLLAAISIFPTIYSLGANAAIFAADSQSQSKNTEGLDGSTTADIRLTWIDSAHSLTFSGVGTVATLVTLIVAHVVGG